uniref:Gustatory receptor n=1 Tax=Ditylenchus dipsaci TaxID=166011 RepID=A0A915DJN7_9BILA
MNGLFTTAYELKQVEAQQNNDDSAVLNKAIEKKFFRCKTLLHLTGLYYEDSANSAWFWLKVLRAGFYWPLPFIKLPRSLVIFNWMLQAAISEGIFIYWQSRGYIRRLLKNVHYDRGCPKTTEVINRTLLACFSMYTLAALSSLVTVALAVSGNKWYSNIFDAQLLYAFGPITLFLFRFNHSLESIGEEIVGEAAQSKHFRVSEQLSERYTTHVELANRIRIVDSTFEVYTFLMSSNWMTILFTIPEVMFCLFELVGLTASPAKVHAAVREVESIIYGNLRIWKPFNEKVYQIATVFISHANQSSLGITLWGFAVVTKPLILTTMSLTITYLTFLLQVQYKDETTPNSTSSSMFL